MPYDERLAGRIREVLRAEPDIVEKRMFGGLAFLSPDSMFVGIAGDSLMARVGPEAYRSALSRPHVRPMDFTGRSMNGYVFVDPAGVADERELQRWIAQCLTFVRTLPAKRKK